jgi:hypothetical protein
MTENKYSDDDYLSVDLFEDQDIIVVISAKKMVTTRKVHTCHLSLLNDNPHEIPIGSRVRYDRELYDDCGDRTWGNWHTCIGCLDKELDEELGNMEEDDDDE